MKKSVFIVHCVDTEGPLHESLIDTFKRIEEIFGHRISASKTNLKKLQNHEIDLEGDEEAIANLVSPEHLNYNHNWSDIDKMLDTILTKKFREKLLDSSKNGWIYNWFCMDHVGFTGKNPRNRESGYHKIFDYYMKKLSNSNSSQRDLIQFHYHPLPISGNYNDSGTAYINSKNLFEILCRKIIDRQWFPSVFRPGFHTERPDSNWFLEQWIPFDYSNQAVKTKETDQPDLSNGRFGDWRRAPKEWIVYHPSHDDYQIPGNCRRFIARILNMKARHRQISIEDVREGFSRANLGKPTIIAFTNHDFRDMVDEIDVIREYIKTVSSEFPDVNFYFSNAINAIRKVKDLEVISLDLEGYIHEAKEKIPPVLEITSKNSIFGPQPFLAIKTTKGNYHWDNFDFQTKKKWTYTFDNNTIYLNEVEKIGVAANGLSGITEVLIIDIKNNKVIKKKYNA